jgi:hypothetical protein
MLTDLLRFRAPARLPESGPHLRAEYTGQLDTMDEENKLAALPSQDQARVGRRLSNQSYIIAPTSYEIFKRAGGAVVRQ